VTADPLRSTRRAIAVALAAASLAIAGPALAQDKALAESLLNAGKTAMEAGRCNELQGRLATAWSYYTEGARLAQLKGDTERAEAARRLATEMEPKLSKLTVNAAAPTPGMSVTRTRKDSPGERVVAVDVDGGQYVIEATAAGHKPFSTEITVGPQSDRQQVSIPALEPGAPEGTAPPPGDTTAPPADSAGGGEGLMTAGFIVGGVGVVGIGLGAIFGIVASSTASGAEDDPALCPNKQCTAAGREEIDSAETSATISTIGFGVGAAALVGGAVLVILGATSEGGGGASEAASIAVDPVATPEGGGMWVHGAF
jgi:hypothetical protein